LGIPLDPVNTAIHDSAEAAKEPGANAMASLPDGRISTPPSPSSDDEPAVPPVVQSDEYGPAMHGLLPTGNPIGSPLPACATLRSQEGTPEVWMTSPGFVGEAYSASEALHNVW
jgi:hypothetical protein